MQRTEPDGGALKVEPEPVVMVMLTELPGVIEDGVTAKLGP